MGEPLWMTAPTDFEVTVAVLLGLLPSIAESWGGRGLVERRDDPLLSERLAAHHRRALRVLGVSALGMWLILQWWAIPGVILAWIGARSVAHRRWQRLIGERFGFAGELALEIRMRIGFAGFTYSLIAAGPIVAFVPDPVVRLGVAASLALALALWRWKSDALLFCGMGARPLGDAELASAFEPVVARSGVPMPLLMRAGPPGRRFVNAFALPSTELSTVVLSEGLLESCERDELIAIFAHEIAHLEEHPPARLRSIFLQDLALVAVVTLLPALVPESARWIVGGLLPFAVFVVLARRIIRHRGHEGDADLRALELCRDGDALVRGLVRIHRLGFAPRRVDADTETLGSHPSLARRLQAIRARAAEMGDASSDELGVAAALDPVVVGIRGGGLLTLGADTMQVDAAVQRELCYADLVELRLAAGRRGVAELVALHRDGEQLVLPLRDEDAGAVAAALDRLDGALAPVEARPPSHPVAIRFLALVALVLAVPLPALWWMAVPLFLLAWVHPPVLLAAMAGAALGRLAVFGAWSEWISLERPWLTALHLAALAAAMAVLAARTAWRGAGRFERVPVLARLLLVLATVAAWSPVAMANALPDEHRAAAAHLVVASNPMTVVLPAALAAALWVGGRWLARGSALLAAALAGLALWMGAPGTLARVVPAPFGEPMPPLAKPSDPIAAERLFEVESLRLGLEVLDVDPDGRRLLLRDPGAASPGLSAGIRVVGPDRRDLYSPGWAASFVAPEGLLRARTEGTRTHVELVDLDAPREPLWSVTAPGAYRGELRVDAEAGRWTLDGFAMAGGRPILVRGDLEGGDPEVAHPGGDALSAHDLDELWVLDDAHVVLLRLAGGVPAGFHALGLYTLEIDGEGARRELGTMIGWPECHLDPTRSELLCALLRDLAPAPLYRVDPEHGVRPVGLGSLAVYGLAPLGGGLWLYEDLDGPRLLDVDAAATRPIALPEDDESGGGLTRRARFVATYRDGFVTAEPGDGAGGKLIVYRIDPARHALE